MCYACGHPIDPAQKIFRSSLCPGCGKELKVCLNCRFYKPGARWDCHETIQEPVHEKDRANFCDYFSQTTVRNGSDTGAKTRNARSQFDGLFGPS